MKLLLFKHHNYYRILNEDAQYIVGSVHPLLGQQGSYEVTSSIGRAYPASSHVGIVKSLDDALPAFIDFHKKNPAPWKRVSPALCKKSTLFVSLRVEQDQERHWLAYRDDYLMLRDTKPARFATYAEAQRAADAHELDLFPDAKVIDDGLSWLPDPEIDWRSVPYLAEGEEDFRSSGLIVHESSA